MTAVIDRKLVTVYWDRAQAIGLLEPSSAWAFELDEDHYELYRNINAVVYATGIWKITEYHRGEGPLIFSGQETDVDAAKSRVEIELHNIWNREKGE